MQLQAKQHLAGAMSLSMTSLRSFIWNSRSRDWVGARLGKRAGVVGVGGECSVVFASE